MKQIGHSLGWSLLRLSPSEEARLADRVLARQAAADMHVSAWPNPVSL